MRRARVALLGFVATSCATFGGVATERRVIETVPSADELMSGCSMDVRGNAQVLDCDDISIELFDGARPDEIEQRVGGDAVIDQVALTAAGRSFDVRRARVPNGKRAGYEIKGYPRRLVRCLGDGSAETETRCLATIASLAGNAPPAPSLTAAIAAWGSSPPLDPPVWLPPSCERQGEHAATCGTALLTWHVITDDDDVLIAVRTIHASRVDTALDVAIEGPFQCAVANKRSACMVFGYAGGGVAYGTVPIQGRRVLATCAWQGNAHDPPPACATLLELVY